MTGKFDQVKESLSQLTQDVTDIETDLTSLKQTLPVSRNVAEDEGKKVSDRLDGLEARLDSVSQNAEASKQSWTTKWQEVPRNLSVINAAIIKTQSDILANQNLSETKRKVKPLLIFILLFCVIRFFVEPSKQNRRDQVHVRQGLRDCKGDARSHRTTSFNCNQGWRRFFRSSNRKRHVNRGKD